jgi:hypothetical protein
MDYELQLLNVPLGDLMTDGSNKINDNFQALEGAINDLRTAVSAVAGEDLGRHRLVYADSGVYRIATSSETEQKADVVGITLESIQSGETGTIQFGNGVVSDGEWTWVPGTKLFLGLDGLIVNNPSSYTYTKPIGFAISSTSIYFNVQVGFNSALIGAVDPDLMELSFSPTTYTPSLTPDTTKLIQLGSHLKGIDNSYSPIGHLHTTNDISDFGSRANLVSGLVPVDELGNGAADSNTYLRGDQTWSVLVSGNAYTTVTAGEDLDLYDAVYINPLISSQAYKARNDGTVIQSEILGVVVESEGILEGNSGQILVTGLQSSDSWAWVPYKWLFASSTPGKLTQALTTVDGKYATPVAIALTSTDIYVQPMTGWVVNNTKNIPLGCKKTSFSETSGLMSVFIPPQNATLIRVTVVITSPASGSGGEIRLGTAIDNDTYLTSTAIDLTQAGVTTHDLYTDLGEEPLEILLSVVSGGQTFTGNLFLDYAIPNEQTGIGGIASASFTEETPSPLLLTELPDNTVVTRCAVIVDIASSSGSPSINIGSLADPEALFDSTDCNLLNTGIYTKDAYSELGSPLYVTIDPDSQVFAGRVYVQYMTIG